MVTGRHVRAAVVSRGGQMAQSMEHLQTLGRERLDAMARSAVAAAASCQSLAAELVDYVKLSVEEGASTVERMASVRSFDALVALQSDYARGAVEAAVLSWTRMAELQSQLVRAMAVPFQPAPDRPSGVN